MRQDLLDWLLLMALGFLGSFGHCLGMCGPLTIAFSLSARSPTAPKGRQQVYFHLLLNLGRIVSYALVGAGIGAIGSVLIAGGQIAGIGSVLRRSLAIASGVLLIWFGLAKIQPDLLPRLPLLHPTASGTWHDRLSAAMAKVSRQFGWGTPLLLGLLWGLMPCGFLYAAQIKAAGSGNLWAGGAAMLAFGLGTLPTMLGVGVFASKLSSEQRSQLFRLGGWVTLIIGVLMLLRTGDTTTDYTGYGAILCLILASIARPISKIWCQPLRYRRALGVAAYLLSVAHTGHMLDHSLDWNLQAVEFMLPAYQLSLVAGTVALALMTPAALTSFDRIQHYLGKRWRQIHLLVIPALILCAAHAMLISSDYLGALQWTRWNILRAVLLGALTLGVLLIRWRWIWSLFCLERFYVPPSTHK